MMYTNSQLNGTTNLSLETDGICSSCGKKSECKCDRCGDYYCSEECQRKDWPKHRYICLPMPKLVKVAPVNNSTNETRMLVKVTPVNNSTNETINKETHSELITKDAKAPRQSKPPGGSCVLLMAFQSTNRCFIRSTNPSVVLEHEKILNEINNFGTKSSVLSEKPKIDSYALTSRKGKWCRVQIVGKLRDVYRVSFIDYGEQSNRSFKELKQITPSLLSLPCFIHRAQLKDVNNINNKQKLKTLDKYTNKEYKVEYVKGDKFGGNVELYQWGSSILLNSLIKESFMNSKDDVDNDSVASSSSKVEENTNNNKTENNFNGNADKKQNDTKASNIVKTENKTALIAAGNAERKKCSVPRQIQKQNHCLEPPFEFIHINENDRSVKVMVMDNSFIEIGFIGCLLDKHCENLKSVSQFLKEYTVGDQSYKPIMNEFCLANFENEWYRAKVIEIISDDKFLVLYIDFGNEMELTSKSIRPYPMALDLPCYTTMCRIDGLPEEISEELRKFLNGTCAPFNPLNIDSVRMQQDIPYVKSNELLSKLRNSKLI